MNTIKRSTEYNGEHLAKRTVRGKSIVDLNYLNEISGGNGSFINAMLQAFKDESTIFLRDIEKSLSKYDFLSVARSAHKMKPAGAYIGVNTLTVLMSNLEQAASITNEKDTSSLFTEVKKLIRKILSEIDSYVAEC